MSADGRLSSRIAPTAAGSSEEDESPLGDLAASAAAEGYRAGQQRMPCSHARGRAHSAAQLRGTWQDDRGFALVAYPAEYGNSGVMTFVVNHQDVVFQKDLGLSTARVAGAMTTLILTRAGRTW